MDDKLMLMIPGPTPVPERVLQAMGKHPIGHRTGDFSKIVAAVDEKLKWLHQTQHDVLVVAASGTGAMEAGIINFFSAGDRVIACGNGKFGDRWIKVAKAYGLEVEAMTVEWGQPLDPEAIGAKLQADTEKKIKGVIFTHSETSSGVLNDLEAINRHVKAHGEALIIVDAVTSLGAMSIPVDELGLDVVGSGSQKGYMIPPGLGFVSVSPKAWAAYEKATLPKFYFDLGVYKKNAAKNLTPFTPPINLYFALNEALDMMQAEGLENIFARHARLRQATRDAVKALGFTCFAPDTHASPAVTAATPPDGVGADDLRKVLSSRFDISIAGGQDHLKGKIIRIGHLGFISDRDTLMTIAAIEAALLELGCTSFTPGAGVAAAAKAFK
ncbi:MAG: pyridoxal-phosphate-dependent aminotransferase family protein [Prochlorothrix sp.]|nr:alanine--glyoxylate aminotransferase family protein [Prochlorothrix sp.]